MTESRLVFTNESPAALTKAFADAHTLIIADPFNAPLLEASGVETVDDQVYEHIEEIKRSRSYRSVLAVGGCTALDFARACAINRPLVVVPTILSNSCLSTDRSVIKRGGIYRSEKTSAPQQTLISIPAVMHSHSEPTNKWSGSGIADLFAAISAAIEWEWSQRGRSFVGMTLDSLARWIPLCMDAFEWSMTLIGQLEKRDLLVLAYYLHESSLDVVRNGHSTLNAGAEHALYYQMQQRRKYPKSIATHGRLVSIGTLLTTHLFADRTCNTDIYELLQRIYRTVRLPMSYAELSAFGIHREHVFQGLREVSDMDCLYSHLPMDELCSRLDAIYGMP